MLNYILNQEFAYLKLAAETSATAARKNTTWAFVFHQNSLSFCECDDDGEFLNSLLMKWKFLINKDQIELINY